MTIVKLQLKLLLKKADLEIELDKCENDNENYISLFGKYAFVSGVLTGLSMITVDEESIKKLYEMLNNKDDENGSEEFINKIYKE